MAFALRPHPTWSPRLQPDIDDSGRAETEKVYRKAQRRQRSLERLDRDLMAAHHLPPTERRLSGQEG